MVGNLKRLLAVVRLRDQQFTQIDAQFFRVEAIKGVFGVDKGSDAAPPLRFGYGVDGQRRLSGAFRPIDFDDAAFRITAHAECIVEGNAPRRNDFNIFDFLVV